MYKNPFYIAEIHASNCEIELLINDVPCFNNYKKGGVAVDWPINQYILNSGKQFYTIKANCFENEDRISKYAVINFKITLRDAFDFSLPKQTVKQHFKMSFEDKDTQMYSTGDIFEANVPFTLKGWIDSFSFSDYSIGNNPVKQKLIEEFSDFYEVFHKIIKNRDLNKYNSINAQRFKEVATAFYLNDDEKVERQISILNSSIKDGEKINFSEFALHFYGNKNQLVGMKIKNQPCGFVFENEEGMIITELALFHKENLDSPLSLIR